MSGIHGMIHWAPGVTLDDVEKQVILTAFQHFQKNKTATANALGIAIRTLDNKLEKYAEDEEADKERQKRERIERDDFLRRARGLGKLPDNVFLGGPERDSVLRAAAGVDVQPAPGAAKEHAVPVSEREKVQSVLPAKAAAHSEGRRR